MEGEKKTNVTVPITNGYIYIEDPRVRWTPGGGGAGDKTGAAVPGSR